MVVIVTGAAGFIGSQLVDRLLAGGARVVGVDDLSRGIHANLSDASRHAAFTFVEADLADEDAAVAALDGALGDAPVDIIWHLAANSDIVAGVDDPRIDMRDTFLTTFNMLAYARRRGARRFAFASTSAVYGEHAGQLAEGHGPLLPISSYGAAKLAGEAFVSASAEAFLDRAYIFRFANVVGPRATHGVIYDLLGKLRIDTRELAVLGDGSQQKPYMHVRELIEAMLFIVAAEGEGPRELYNIGPEDDGFSVAGIAEAVLETVGSGARIRYLGGDRGWVGDVPRFSYSTEKLGRLGWRPSLTSEEAVRVAVKQIAKEMGFP